MQEFDDYRDADDAVYELNHKELLGTRIALEHARPNKEKYERRDRYSGGDRYGGGGRGGFRFRDKLVEVVLNRIRIKEFKIR